MALYIGGFKFVPPSEMQQRTHRGVVHLSVENTTDEQSGSPAKLITILAVIGNIERTLPAVGTRWIVELAKYGDGELGLRRGFNHTDDKPPMAHLRHAQQVLWLEQQKRGRTVSQALGLAAYQEFEAWRQEKRRPGKKGGKGKSEGQQAQGTAAPAAEPAAEATAPADPNATGTPAAVAPSTGGRRRRDRRRKIATPAGDGSNGVPPGTTATPALVDDDPPTT